jgi:hypothetical protein
MPKLTRKHAHTHTKTLNSAWDDTDNWSLLHALKLSWKNEGK